MGVATNSTLFVVIAGLVRAIPIIRQNRAFLTMTSGEIVVQVLAKCR
jgi:hypothetical protein